MTTEFQAWRKQFNAAKPIATLHDDGYYTFKRGQEPYGACYAGWRIDVYAAPITFPAEVLGAIAYELTKRLVIDMPTARNAVDAAIKYIESKENAESS